MLAAMTGQRSTDEVNALDDLAGRVADAFTDV
jgi:hypothetical protein